MSEARPKKKPSSIQGSLLLGALLLAVPAGFGILVSTWNEPIRMAPSRKSTVFRSHESDKEGMPHPDSMATKLRRGAYENGTAPEGAQKTSDVHAGPIHPDDAQIARFDANAEKFDRLLGVFAREIIQSFDGELSTELQSVLHAHFAERVSSASTRVRCTASTCVVEVTSSEPVGTLIARLSGWRLKHPEVASGDPEDPDDERGLRFVLDRAEALKLLPKQPN